MGGLIPEATIEKKGLMPSSMTRLYGKKLSVIAGYFVKIVSINKDYKQSLIRINISPMNNFASENMMSITVIASSENGIQKYRAVKMGNTSMASLYYNEEGLFLQNKYKYSSVVFLELASASSDNLVGEILSEGPTDVNEII